MSAELFVYLSTDDDGVEGVSYMETAAGTKIPLVADTENRAQLLRPIAERLASLTHRDITLARFSRRVDIETLCP
jgi:hypothetical protein